MQDVPVIVDVLSNDAVGPVDNNGDGLEVSISSSPANGQVVTVSDGQTFMYSPNSGFDGIDMFEYSVSDSQGNAAVAKVTISVLPLCLDPDDDAPTITNRFIDIRQDGTTGIINSDGSGVGNDATALQFRLNNATRMTVRSTGDVGVGTTNPLARLDVRGNNILLAPLASSNHNGKFVGLGESGGGPGTTPCDL